MKKQTAVLDTSFWVLGHRADVLAYLFRFFTIVVPSTVENEIQARDPRYPQRVYGYQELFGLMKQQGVLAVRDPVQPLDQFHAGEAAALGLALDENLWLLVNEQRALRFARQRGLKALTVPEFTVYLYEIELLSWHSVHDKLDRIAANTGKALMNVARQAVQSLAESRGDL